ncbi:MAG: 23S rRNA (adenine(2503)-C(2))-methyltransferase RlmN [Ruminococcaceae bacterium]|nr:23S rRNA (adenine(2503)-C(2))-methyltransferase RlmN [Oscillospiraceae bacterium]
MKQNIKNLLFSELEEYFLQKYRQKFRAKQIFKWLSLGVTSFEEMTDISKKMAAELSEDFYISDLKVVKKEVSRDGTVKFLYELGDGNTIESVLMDYKHGYSICISTQVGCNMGCTFCASTVGGKVRDLEAGEILDQVLFTAKGEGKRISNIVLMGIGEPLDNYENVLRFLKNVNDEHGINIGYRHISLSTCGLVDGINRLAEENIPLTLSVSLHAPNDTIRNKTMPVSRKYPYETLLKAVKQYVKKTGRRVSFEYTLIKDVNDRPEHAKELIGHLKGMLCHVNLIPVNPARGSMSPSEKKRIAEFQQMLMSGGLNATVRRTLGTDINAACGQLRRAASNRKEGEPL